MLYKKCFTSMIPYYFLHALEYEELAEIAHVSLRPRAKRMRVAVILATLIALNKDTVVAMQHRRHPLCYYSSDKACLLILRVCATF